MAMDDPEHQLERYEPTLYSAGDTARQLGVSVNMLRRYAKALESLQGKDAIYTDPQRGRLYTQQQVDLLQSARDYIYANRGASVDEALRLALGMDDAAPARVPTPPPSEAVLRRAVAEALGVALTGAVAPLERELAELRAEVAGLRRELAVNQRALPQEASQSQQEPPQSAPVGDSGDVQAGVLVRAATRLERLWRRWGQQ